MLKAVLMRKVAQGYVLAADEPDYAKLFPAPVQRRTNLISQAGHGVTPYAQIFLQETIFDVTVGEGLDLFTMGCHTNMATKCDGHSHSQWTQTPFGCNFNVF